MCRLSKGFLLLALSWLIACSHGPKLAQRSHQELTEFVMKQSLLDAALSTSIMTASNCIQPFHTSMPQPVFNRLKLMIEQNFNYDEMHRSIQQKLVQGSERKEMLNIAEQLNSKAWEKLLSGVNKINQQGQQEYTALLESLEKGTFDLHSQRTRLVAAITDQAFMVNLVRISNSQVLRMLSLDSVKPLSEKQKNVMNWIGQELNAFNVAHIKTLFLTTWLATKSLSEEELKEVLNIRSHQVLKLGKAALEQELAQRYHNFFKQMTDFKASGMTTKR